MNELSTSLQDLAATQDWGALLPELFLSIGALLLLLFEVAVPRVKVYLPQVAIGLQVLLLLFVGSGFWLNTTVNLGDRELFAGMIVQNGTTDLLRFFFLLCGVMVSHLGLVFLRRRVLAKVEFFHLVMIVTAGFMLLVQSNHFAMLFVTLEMVTIGFYILVAYSRKSRFSLEAGLKYLITGALSSGMMLFGIVLLFGAGSNPELSGASGDPLHYGELGNFIASGNSDSLMVLVGALLVLGGLAFKIGVVPFQVWIPDVYQGAPTPITAFLAIASKAAGVFLLLTLLQGPFAPLASVTIPFLTVLAGATMLVGNLAALGQRNVKRLMGLSGVSHAGILLMGVIAVTQLGAMVSVLYFYLFVYALGSFGVFEVMAHVGADEDADQDADYYNNLLAKQPLLGAGLIIGVGSLAGIPPLAGFVAKLLIFYAAYQAGLYVLLGLALFGVVVSIYYYFGWIRSSVMKSPSFGDEPLPEPLAPAWGARFIIYSVSILSVILGLYQGFFTLG